MAVNGPRVVYSDRYLCDIGPHVFRMDKYPRIAAALREDLRLPDEVFVEPRPATREELELAHDRAYLDDVLTLQWTRRTASSELPLHQDIVDLAVLSTGGTLVAADLARAHGAAYHVGGGWHHAFGGHAEGFCYLNDVAVAIRRAQRDGHAARVAVVDLDLHQGNGTAGIFRREASVFTFSMHQEHLYPVKQKSTLDIGLPEFTDDAAYLGFLAPALDRIFGDFKPELVFYLAGADPYKEDQLGQLQLTLEGLKARDREVLRRCRAGGIPVVVCLAGGYARNADDTVAIHVNTARVLFELWGALPGSATA